MSPADVQLLFPGVNRCALDYSVFESSFKDLSLGWGWGRGVRISRDPEGKKQKRHFCSS